MAACLDLFTSPAATTAVAAALLWPALTGLPTRPDLSRGVVGDTLAASLAVGARVSALVWCLTATASN